jgi:site-specific DNA-methyltransferase (adenine-specific)
MGYHYRATYEFILFFEKGKRKLLDLGVSDVITVKRIRGGYPAEKPPEVSQVLISQSSEPGQLIVDPFMGSGSVGVASLRLGRRFFGNDVSDDAHAHARPRLLELGTEVTSDAVLPANVQLALGER